MAHPPSRDTRRAEGPARDEADHPLPDQIGGPRPALPGPPERRSAAARAVPRQKGSTIQAAAAEDEPQARPREEDR